MEVTLAALADAANISREGKLNLTGIFDSIAARSFPTTHAAMSFAFRLKAEYGDKNSKRRLQVNLIDQDAKVLWGAAAEIQIGDIAPGQFTQVNQVVNLAGVTFPAPGRYRFRIRMKGVDAPVDTVFQVVKAKSQSRP